MRKNNFRVITKKPSFLREEWKEVGRKGDVTGGKSASFLVKHKAVVMGTLLVATMSIIMYYVMLRIYVITHPISMLLHSHSSETSTQS